MTKKYSWLGILLVLTQPFFLQISSIDADTSDLFTIGSTSNDVIDSFYYSMYKASAWTGYYKLEAWFDRNQEVRIKYSLTPSRSLNLSQSTYFPFSEEFDKTVQGYNWSYYTNLIGLINNWNSNTTSGLPYCDGGTFTEQIKIYKSGSLVNSSVYTIDNNSCTGKRSIPHDSNVILLMGKINDYIIELASTPSETQICTPTFNITFFLLSVFVLSIILSKRKS